MSKISISEAINRAIREEMRANDKIYMIGEDIGVMGGAFGVTRGLYEEFGSKRIIDAPISEQMQIGSAVGAAIAGLVPIVELMFSDFMAISFDQIANQAAKTLYMSGGQNPVPMVIRLPCGSGVQAAGHHSQNLEALVNHIPGLKVVYASNPQDVYGLMLTSIRDQNPVMFFEHKILYGMTGEFDPSLGAIPFGKAAVKKEGSDVTVVATGKCVLDALATAEKLEKEGISVEVIDPRTLYPLDKETIFKSVDKTGRLVVLTEECKRGAWSGELAAIVAEERFDSLKKKIVRVGSMNTTVPLTRNQELYVLPQGVDLIRAVKSVL